MIPAKDTDRNTIIGIGTRAFYKKGLTSVTFPKGVMASYSGSAIAEGLTERGNFIIQNNSFTGRRNLCWWNSITEQPVKERKILSYNLADWKCSVC